MDPGVLLGVGNPGAAGMAAGESPPPPSILLLLLLPPIRPSVGYIVGSAAGAEENELTVRQWLASMWGSGKREMVPAG